LGVVGIFGDCFSMWQKTQQRCQLPEQWTSGPRSGFALLWLCEAGFRHRIFLLGIGALGYLAYQFFVDKGEAK
jgi:uncharacterized membrane protein YjjB (DUF3815 family)